ncbi:MAG TPA: TMEM175 family protein [Steroidobacteraceae bacterium]
MNAARLEAFTDGVVAIIITIMVLEIRVPHGSDLAALQADLPLLAAYVLSYVNVGIFWNNHHHMLHLTERVNGKVLWANLALLFWLSLVPFVIRWLDEAGFTALPTAAYGVVLVCAGASYQILQRQIIAHNGRDSRLAIALGNDLKGKGSLILYATAIVLAFVRPWLAITLYVAVALLWLVPDKRLESLVK